MGTYRLTAPHYISDMMLGEGTLVGDGTPYPIPSPSLDMVGVDEASQSDVTAFHEEVRRRNAANAMVDAQYNAQDPARNYEPVRSFTNAPQVVSPTFPPESVHALAERQETMASKAHEDSSTVIPDEQVTPPSRPIFPPLGGRK